MLLKFSKLFIIPALLFLPFLFVTAQTKTLNVSYSPTYPEVGALVTVSLSGIGVDLSQSPIAWYKDGKLDKRATGMRTYTFNIEEKGNTIRAVVEEGQTPISQTVIINPSSMDLLWEVPGGYAPPFYRGKIMPVKSSSVRIVAIPQITNNSGNVFPPETFSFGWRKDGSNEPGKSGSGQDAFSYMPQVLDQSNEIEVLATGNSRSLSKRVVVPLGTPDIQFYEYSRTAGPFYNKALLNNQTIRNRTFGVTAEPFFAFTNNINNPSLVTEFKLNRAVIKTDIKNVAILEAQRNVSSFDISFSVDNASALLQSASKSIKLILRQ